MIAKQIEIGQFFITDGDVLQRIPNYLGTDGWERYPGVLCVNTCTGGFHGLGGYNSAQVVDRPDNPRREMIMADVVKLDKREYEFGIGSLSQADDPYYTDTQYQPTGEKREKLVGRGLKRGPMPNGTLDQPCDVRGCRCEPVCVDCELCENHCHCGD